MTYTSFLNCPTSVLLCPSPECIHSTEQLCTSLISIVERTTHPVPDTTFLSSIPTMYWDEGQNLECLTGKCKDGLFN